MPARQYTNVCFTHNNPEVALVFVPEKMRYLVYQEEIGDGTDEVPEGTYHFQGYCELLKKMSLEPLKQLLGGTAVHVELRRGTAEQAADYCKKDDTKIPGTPVYEEGQLSAPGKRNDLVAFKEDVQAGKRKRDLLDDHLMTLARYPKLYDTINYAMPTRQEPVIVTLLIGPSGLGKTRFVYDKYQGDDDLYITPLSNGTMWYDNYDGHKYVLIDDFAGAASHMTLTCLLRLIDRYPVQVPTKGSHTWWFPTHIYLTTNILPKDWYKWENRAEQYKALGRRFSHVVVFQEDADPLEEGDDWWVVNAPDSVHYYIAPNIQN